MNHRLLIFSLLLTSAYAAFGQPPYMRRTPEEVAMKQTEMLVRDLDITDSLTRDTLYKVHLHFARMRHPHPSEEEIRQHRDSLSKALQGILTSEQYLLLQQRQTPAAPRYPQPPVNRFTPQPNDSCVPHAQAPNGAPRTPPPPPGYLL